MGYTPVTINPGDVARSAWANKVENFMAQTGNYLGIVQTKADLPPSADLGDWYLVVGNKSIYMWDGEKWTRVGGNVNYVLDDTLIELVDTSIEVVDETPSGTADGTNTTFTTLNTPIWAGTLSITVDGATTITDNGDGTLSDGGTVDYATGTFTLATAPTTSITCSYRYEYWDGIKYVDIGLDPDYPEKIIALFDIKATAGAVKARVCVYDGEDDTLLDSQEFSAPADGNTYTYQAEFDIGNLSRPGFVYVQLEINASPGTSGEQSLMEVRWL